MTKKSKNKANKSSHPRTFGQNKPKTCGFPATASRAQKKNQKNKKFFKIFFTPFIFYD